MPDILSDVKKASKKISLITKRRIVNFLFILLLPFVLALMFFGSYNIIVREFMNVDGAFLNYYYVEVKANDNTAKVANYNYGDKLAVNITVDPAAYIVGDVIAYYTYIPTPSEGSDIANENYENATSEVFIGIIEEIYRDNINVWYSISTDSTDKVLIESDYVLGDVGTISPYIISYLELYDNIYIASALLIVPPVILLLLMLYNISSYFSVKKLIKKVLVGEISLFDKKCVKKNVGYYLNSEIKTQIYQAVAPEDKEIYGYLLWKKWENKKDEIIAEMNGMPIVGRKKSKKSKKKRKKDYQYTGNEKLPVISDEAGFFHFSDDTNADSFDKLTEHAGESVKDYYDKNEIKEEQSSEQNSNIYAAPEPEKPIEQPAASVNNPQQAQDNTVYAQSAPQPQQTVYQQPQAPLQYQQNNFEQSQPVNQPQQVYQQQPVNQPQEFYQQPQQAPQMQTPFEQPPFQQPSQYQQSPQAFQNSYEQQPYSSTQNYYAQVSDRPTYSTANPRPNYYGLNMYDTPRPIDSMSNMYGFNNYSNPYNNDKISSETLRRELSESERFLFENYITPIESRINNLKSELDGLVSNYRNLEYDVSDKFRRIDGPGASNFELQNKVAQLEEWIATIENFQNDLMIAQNNMSFSGGVINDTAYNELKLQQEDNLLKLNVLFDDIEQRLNNIEASQRNIENVSDNAFDEVLNEQMINSESIASIEMRLNQIEETKGLLEKAKQETIRNDRMDEKSALIREMTRRIEKIESSLTGKSPKDDMLDFTDKSDRDMAILNNKLKDIETVLEEMRAEKSNAEREIAELSNKNGRLLDDMVRRINRLDGGYGGSGDDLSMFNDLAGRLNALEGGYSKNLSKNKYNAVYEELNNRLSRLEQMRAGQLPVNTFDNAIMEKFRSIDSAIEKIGTELSFRDRIDQENRITRDKMEMLNKMSTLENKLYVMENMRFLPAKSSDYSASSLEIEQKIQKEVSDRIGLLENRIRTEIREQNQKFADILSARAGIDVSKGGSEEYNLALPFNKDVNELSSEIERKFRQKTEKEIYDIQNDAENEARALLIDASRESEILSAAAEKEAQIVKAAAEKEIQLMKKQYAKEIEDLKSKYSSVQKIDYNDLIEMREKAEQEADEILDEAEEKANKILENAKEKIQSLEREEKEEIDRLRRDCAYKTEKVKKDAYRNLLEIRKKSFDSDSDIAEIKSEAEISSQRIYDDAGSQMESYTVELEDRIKQLRENAEKEIERFKVQAEKAAQIVKEEAEKVINIRRKSVENVNSISKELFAIHKDAEREAQSLIEHARKKEIEINEKLERDIEKLKEEALLKQNDIRSSAQNSIAEVKSGAEKRILKGSSPDAEKQSEELVKEAEKQTEIIKLQTEKEIVDVKSRYEQKIRDVNEDARREAQRIRERAETVAKNIKQKADRRIERLKNNISLKNNSYKEMDKLSALALEDDIFDAEIIVKDIKEKIAEQASVIKLNAEKEAARIRNEASVLIRNIKDNSDKELNDYKSQILNQKALENNVADIKSKAELKAKEIISQAEQEVEKIKSQYESQAKEYYDKSKHEADLLLSDAEINADNKLNESENSAKNIIDEAEKSAEALLHEGSKQTEALRERAKLEVDKIRAKAEEEAQKIIDKGDYEIELLNKNSDIFTSEKIAAIRIRTDKLVDEINKKADLAAREIKERRDADIERIKQEYEKVASELSDKAENKASELIAAADEEIEKKETVLESDSKRIKDEAEITAKHIKEDAEEEKSKILEKAEQEAENIIADAKKKAEELLNSVERETEEEEKKFSDSLDGFSEEELRAKLNKVLEDAVNEADRIRKENEEAVSALIASSQNKAGEIIQKAQKRAQEINSNAEGGREEAKMEAELESLKILQRAEAEAQMILENAEEEKEKLRLKAEEDAKRIIDVANAEAEKHRIVLDSREEYIKNAEEERIEKTRLINEKRANAEKEAARILDEARKIADEIKNEANKKGESLIEIAEKNADKVIQDSEIKLQSMINDINKQAILKKQQLEREAIEAKAKAEEEILALKRQAELDAIKTKEQALLEVEKIRLSAQIESEAKKSQLNKEIEQLKEKLAKQAEIEKQLREEIRDAVNSRDEIMRSGKQEAEKLQTLSAKEAEAIKKSIEKQAYGVLKVSEERAESIISKAGLEADKIRLKTEIEAEQIKNNAEKEANLLKLEAEKEAFELRSDAGSKAQDVKLAMEKQALQILDKAEKEAKKLREKAELKAKELRSGAEIEIQYLLENNEENLQKLLEYNARPKKKTKSKKNLHMIDASNDLEAYINSVIEQYRLENSDIKLGDVKKIKEFELLDKLNQLRNKIESIRLREKIVKDYISYSKRRMLDAKKNEIERQFNAIQKNYKKAASLGFADNAEDEGDYIDVSEFESSPENQISGLSKQKVAKKDKTLKSKEVKSVTDNSLKMSENDSKSFIADSEESGDKKENIERFAKEKDFSPEFKNHSNNIINIDNAIEYGNEAAAAFDDDIFDEEDDEESDGSSSGKRAPKLLVRLKEADKVTQDNFTKIKNYILSFIGVNDRFSYKFDTFTYNRLPLIKLSLRNKTLKLYFNINPAIVDPKYFVKDMSALKMYEQTPTLLRVASNRGVKYAMELVDMVMKNFSIKPKSNFSPLNFSQLVYGVSPYETALAKLKKVIKKPAYITDIPKLDDESAEALILVKSSADNIKYKNAPVVELTVSQIADNFNDGEVADIDAMKEKGLLNKDKIQRVRVTVSDKPLNKELTIIANEFTEQAAKLIMIAGGKAVVLK